MLLVFGCLASYFSVNVFAAASPQKSLPLGSGHFALWWNSDYNGNGLSMGDVAGDAQHTMTITSWSSNNHSGEIIKNPKVLALKIDFEENVHMSGGCDFLLNLSALPGGAKFNNDSYPVVCSFSDQYNNTVWSETFYTPGTKYTQNGFLYCIIRDLPVSIDFKYLYINFSDSAGYYPVDNIFATGKSAATWLQIIQLARGTDADDVIKAIEDQTAADQSRYDDFTSDGSQQGSSAVDATKTAVSEKIGILDFAEGVLSDFIGLFSADPGDATLTLPGFKWHDSDTDTELTVWEPQTFDFAFVEEHFGPLVSALRVGTVLTVYGALLWYLQSVFDRIFRGGDGNN